MKRRLLVVASLALWAAGCGPTAPELRARAISEYQVGHIEQSRELFQQALGRNPADQHALYYLGRIASAQSAWEDAIYYYQCCLDVDPSYADARIWLSRAEKSAGSAGGKLRFIPYWPADRPRG
jgi:tetratricopeptide (TPR) repeat protein